jgi:hypothetical protein
MKKYYFKGSLMALLIANPGMAFATQTTLPACDLDPNLLGRIGAFVKKITSSEQKAPEASAFKKMVETVLNTTQGASQLAALIFMYYLYNNHSHLDWSEIASMIGKVGGLSAFSNPGMAWSLVDNLAQKGKKLGAFFFPSAATPLDGKTPRESIVPKSEDSFSDSTEAEEEESPQSLSQNLPVSPSGDLPLSREIIFESVSEPSQVSSLSEDDHGASPDIVITVPKEILGSLIEKAHELKGVKVGRKGTSNYQASMDDLKNDVTQWVKKAKEAAPHAPFGDIREPVTATHLKEILTQGIKFLKSMGA